MSLSNALKRLNLEFSLKILYSDLQYCDWFALSTGPDTVVALYGRVNLLKWP